MKKLPIIISLLITIVSCVNEKNEAFEAVKLQAPSLYCSTENDPLTRTSISVDEEGIGTIYWNEQNDCSQPLYGLFSATFTAEWKYVKLQLWGRNLTGTSYDVFYFRSMGNDFLQKGKPRELGTTIQFEF